MPFWKIFSPHHRADFFDLLHQHAAACSNGCRALVAFLGGHGDPEEVKRWEKQADDLRRVLIDELNQTFITPIDREDMYSLSRALDEVVDHAKNTVREMQAFEVVPNDRLRAMAALLLEGAEHLVKAVEHLKDHPNVAVDHALRAKKVENKMIHEYLAALKELFAGSDMRMIFSLREVYRHLARSAERVDEAAYLISGIVVKMN
ncbi:MAG: DUF47 family protein [Myxococcales bacterium]|nr:MAG: DUF47 family protein [Myxococcales bacterium]